MSEYVGIVWVGVWVAMLVLCGWLGWYCVGWCVGGYVGIVCWCVGGYVGIVCVG